MHVTTITMALIVQNKMIHYICDYNKRTDFSTGHFESLKWLNIVNRVQHLAASRKCLNVQAPDYLQVFAHTRDLHRYDPRHAILKTGVKTFY